MPYPSAKVVISPRRLDQWYAALRREQNRDTCICYPKTTWRTGKEVDALRQHAFRWEREGRLTLSAGTIEAALHQFPPAHGGQEKSDAEWVVGALILVLTGWGVWRGALAWLAA